MTSIENQSTAEKLLAIFGGQTFYAIGRANKNGTFYKPVEEPLTLERIIDHLEGTDILGAYQLMPDNTINWVAWDVDAEGDMDAAREITSMIIDRLEGLPFAVEYSGWKGYHVFLFLDDSVPAESAKRVVESVRDELGINKAAFRKVPHVECYPKQGSIKEKGSLIKLPLGQHPFSHNWSRFVDPTKDWEEGPSMDPNVILGMRITPQQLYALSTIPEVDAHQTLVELLADEWTQNKRHNLALFLSGYLANIGWSFESTKSLIVDICELAGDVEVDNRMDTVESTFRKLIAGESVAGLSQLGNILPGTVIRRVMQMAPNLASPDKARQIDAIRLGRGPIYKKQEQIVNLMWSELSDAEIGRPIRVGHSTGRDFDSYWYDATTHLVYRLGSRQWENFVYERFGLNPGETFSSTIAEGLRRRFETRAFSHSKVYRASAWVDGILFIHLGGPDIWVLDGKNAPFTAYNGGIRNVFFWTDKLDAFAAPSWDVRVDAWDFMVNDLNFTRSKNSPLSDEQQRELLKAWILAQFFREEMPTRPLLTLLGAAGSGKTTGARRILRILEGMESNVLNAQEDKPDFLRAAIENHRVLVLDNLEQTQMRWLPHNLDLLATGGHIEIRELYKTNASYIIPADVFVILTAITMPFSKETTFNRMLVLEMERLFTFLPEYFFIQRVGEAMPYIWGDLLNKLNQIVALLNSNPEVELNKITNRLADFAYFCYRIKNSPAIDGYSLVSGLERMQISQQYAQATSEHSLFPVIQEWVENYPDQALKPNSAGALLLHLKDMLQERRIPVKYFPASPLALSHHLRSLQELLQRELGMEIDESYDARHGRSYNLYTFPAADQMADRRKKLDNLVVQPSLPEPGSNGNDIIREGARMSLRRIVRNENEES